MGGCSRGKNSSPLSEFTQLPTTKLSVTHLPYCFDETVDQGTATATDLIPHACAFYACHWDPEVCQQQRMRDARFLCDTDSAM